MSGERLVTRAMHLAVDGMGARRGGGATGLLEFLSVAVADQRVLRITLFCSPKSRSRVELPVSEKLRVIENDWVDRSYFARILWYELLLGLTCRALGADLLFVSANFGRGRFGVPHVTYVRQSLMFSREAVATLESLFDRARACAYGRQMKRSCLTAARIICQSSVMRDCLNRSLGVPAEKIEVIYSSARKLPQEVRRHRTLDPMRRTPEGGRILYVGDPNPYKMIETAITGLDLVRQVRPAARLFLTVPRDHRFSRVPFVSCIGYLGPFELREAYELADMLILPSLVESGPQPPLEAMSAGKPVLIADRPYARDIFGDAALRFDPLDPKDFAEKALCILSDPEERQRLVKRGYRLVKERYEAKPYQRMVDICYEAFVAKQAERLKTTHQEREAFGDGTGRESER